MKFIITTFEDDTFEIYWGGYDTENHTDAVAEHYEYTNPYDISERLEEFIQKWVELTD